MDKQDKGNSNYIKFFAMIATSMVVMYLLTYLNSYEIFGHAWFSETRLFMVFIMGGAMMIIMLAYMLGMYHNRKANGAIFAGGLLLMIAAVLLVRSQTTVDDVDYMEGMIPHHSIAILTSRRAVIKDPRVRKLADGISETQVREIREMEWLIRDIRENGIAADQAQADARPIPNE